MGKTTHKSNDVDGVRNVRAEQRTLRVCEKSAQCIFASKTSDYL